MAIALVNAAETTLTGTATSHNHTLQASISSGNLLVLYCSTQESAAAGAPATPSGWTQRWNLGHASSFKPEITCFYKIADGTESSTSVTLDWGSTNVETHVVSLQFSGMDSSTPFDATQSSPTSGGSNPDPNAVTTATNDAWVIGIIAGNRSPSTSSPTISSGYSTLYDQTPDARAFIIEYKQVATAGSENPGALTWTPIDNHTTVTDSIRPLTSLTFSASGSMALSATGATKGDLDTSGSGSAAMSATGAIKVGHKVAATGAMALSATGEFTIGPTGDSDAATHIFHSGRWWSIGAYIRNPVTIRRGRSSWSGMAEPTSITAELDNRDGRWSPFNRTSVFHPNVTRNLPVRAGVRGSETYLAWRETDGLSMAYAASHSSFDLTGDFDVRVEFQLLKYLRNKDIFTDEIQYLASRATFGPLTGWWWTLFRSEGYLKSSFDWYDNGGTFHQIITDVGDLPHTLNYERSAMRVTLDISTGTAEWFVSDSIDGTWTSVSTGTIGAATTVAASTTSLKAGWLVSTWTKNRGFAGRYYALELRNGIGGSLVADADFTAQTAGASSFTGGAGRTWTIATDSSQLTRMVWRGHGELSSMPVRWTEQSADLWSPIQANGVLRRLLRRSVENSATYRGVIQDGSVVGYWPCEETGFAELLSPGVGKASIRFHNGYPEFAKTAPFASSRALPEMGSEVWVVNPDSYGASDSWELRWYQLWPEGAFASNAVHIRINAGELLWFVETRSSDDALQVRVVKDGATVHSSGYYSVSTLYGFPTRAALRVEQNGSDIDYTFVFVDDDNTVGSGFSDTVTSQTNGNVRSLQFNFDGLIGGTVMGHIALHSAAIGTDALVDVLTAHRNEPAGRRIVRLLEEEGIPFLLVGDPDDTVHMGAQGAKRVSELLAEAADTDVGLLTESADWGGLEYRTGAHMRNQVAIEVEHAKLKGTPQVDRDDRIFANDVTVTNWDTTVGRRALEDGSFASVSEPPVGSGRYDVSHQINRGSSLDLQSAAGERMALWSTMAPVVQAVRFALHNGAWSTADLAELYAMRLGTLIDLTGGPALLGVSSLPQLMQGTTEVIGPVEHTLDINLVPGEPWTTGVYDTELYDTAGSSLASAASAGATSLSVATDLGPLWTTSSATMPFVVMVDEIPVTVTAISGSSSPQTFTVTGATVVRALPSGATVKLAAPARYTL